MLKISLHHFFRFLNLPKNHLKKQTSINLNSEKTKQVIAHMDELMQLHQPFLQIGYNIKNFADELNVPSYQLSAILNKEMGTNFNNYLNRFRINYCKEIIRQGLADNLNMKGLSAKCGFNNRNTFTVAFKKFTGNNPSVYLKK